jgi:DNA-directed RNA polymerase specialized sigma subunit
MPVDLFAPKAFSPSVATPPAVPAVPPPLKAGDPLPIGKLEPEYHEAYRAWQTGATPLTNYAMLQAMQPIVDTAVQSYGAGSQGSPTMASRAKLMALDSLKTYDPDKGTLRTHLLSSLRGLHRVGAGEANIISMPEQVALDRRHLQESEEELRDQFGRQPSDAELADHTGLSTKRLRHIRQGHTGLNTGAFGESTNAEAYMPASQPLGQSDDDAWLDLVYHDLSATDQVIFQHTLGWNGSPVLDTREIAAKLGLTPGAISQRRKKIQALVDQRHTSGLGI